METTNLPVSEIMLAKLSTQKFATWYGDGGRFDKYLSDNTVSREEILQDIQKMFVDDIKKCIVKTLVDESLRVEI